MSSAWKVVRAWRQSAPAGRPRRRGFPVTGAEHAVLGDGSTIKVGDLPGSLRVSTRTPEQITDPADPSVVRLPANLDWLEARAIDEALKACGGNRTMAASLLGINRFTLYKKLKVD